MLPLAIPLVVGGVGAAISPEGERYLLAALYDAVFAVLSWASFEYVVPSDPLTPSSPIRSLPVLAALAAGLMGAAIVLALVVAPEDADQGLSQRSSSTSRSP